MKRKNLPIFILILAVLGGLVLGFYPVRNFSNGVLAQSNSITVTVQPRGVDCGNGAIDADEECDGNNLAGQTCESQGYYGGTLSCEDYCVFDASGCTSAAPPAAGGGGRYPTQAVFQGRAYPGTVLVVLKDGGVFLTRATNADSGDFNILAFDITPGVYTFGFWAKDNEGRKSATLNVTVTLTRGLTTIISGIFIPPTIELNETTLTKGEILKILGQTAPEAEVSLYFGEGDLVKKTKAQTSGIWSYDFDTSDLKEGSYAIKAKAVTSDGLISSFSQILEFFVSEISEEIPPEEIPPEEIPPEEISKIRSTPDINGDGKVDLIDFSILLYWWGKYTPKTDFNQDKIIDLVDFSIMMYWWTG